MSWHWNVTSGASKITLGSNGSCNISVTAAAASASQADVAITVTVAGVTSDPVTSDPFNLTVRAPTTLVQTGITLDPDATWGYRVEITYSIRDQFGSLLPAGSLPVNEQWTTSLIADYPDMDWRQANQGGTTLSNPVLSDVITGETSSHYPTPQSPGSPGSVKVCHWGQDIFVGSTTPGLGRRVQSNVQQKYTDHAAHENIISPNPN
jgi:hypothetical protein